MDEEREIRTGPCVSFHIRDRSLKGSCRFHRECRLGFIGFPFSLFFRFLFVRFLCDIRDISVILCIYLIEGYEHRHEANIWQFDSWKSRRSRQKNGYISSIFLFLKNVTIVFLPSARILINDKFRVLFVIFHFLLNLLQHIAHATHSRVVFNLREKVHRDVKQHCEKVTFIHVMLLMFMMSAVSRLMSTISPAQSRAAFMDEIWAACRRRRLDLCDKMWSKEWGNAQLSIKSPSSFVFFNFQIDGYHQAERVTWTVVKILLSYLAGTTSKGGLQQRRRRSIKWCFILWSKKEDKNE